MIRLPRLTTAFRPSKRPIRNFPNLLVATLTKAWLYRVIPHFGKRGNFIPSGYAVFGFFLSLVLLVSGCHRDHTQSILHPAGPASAHIAWLSWLLIAICGGTFIGVMILLAIAVFKKSDQPDSTSTAEVFNNPQPLGQRFVVMFGIVFPTLVLVAILLVSVQTQVALKHPETAETIRVVGHMWWWEVHYPDHGIEIANEIHLPVGEPVRIEMESVDVIHSLWIPSLQGKMDLVPGHTTVLWLQADRAGEFRGACAEYCGVQHAKMGLVVVAQSRKNYDRWLVDRQESQAPLSEISSQAERGRDVFFESSCHNCHSIAGSEAIASRGPDLTHIADRKTLAAGLLPNNPANLKKWIEQPQQLKPGSLMPQTNLSPEDLSDLVEYLKSLH